MCSNRAPYVGGIFSIFRPFLVNRSLRASLTVVQVLVLSYMSVMKRSISGIMSFNLSSVGIELSATNAGVISSNTFYVAHAVFLPLPANEEV